MALTWKVNGNRLYKGGDPDYLLFRHVAEHIKETHGDIDYIIMTGTVSYTILMTSK